MSFLSQSMPFICVRYREFNTTDPRLLERIQLLPHKPQAVQIHTISVNTIFYPFFHIIQKKSHHMVHQKITLVEFCFSLLIRENKWHFPFNKAFFNFISLKKLQNLSTSMNIHLPKY